VDEQSLAAAKLTHYGITRNRPAALAVLDSDPFYAAKLKCIGAGRTRSRFIAGATARASQSLSYDK
jgi:hypothetical protein